MASTVCNGAFEGVRLPAAKRQAPRQARSARLQCQATVAASPPASEWWRRRRQTPCTSPSCRRLQRCLPAALPPN